MKKFNVSPENTPQHPEIAIDATTQIPKIQTEWNSILCSEFEKAASLANDFYNRQVKEMNNIIFFYLHNPSTLKLALFINEYQLDLLKIVPADNEKKCKCVRVWSCNHPIKEITDLSPNAREEYYRVCIGLLQAEYGDIQWKKLFFITHDEGDKTKEVTSQDSGEEKSQSSAPAKTMFLKDDVEQFFSHRNQNHQ